ncbi:MAG: hypothetical protein ACYDCK_03595 [Thermoplasmatota archaeon]
MFIIGIAYGWMTPGRQNKMQMFKSGIIIGVVVALVFALLGALFDINPLGLASGFVYTIIAAIILAALFVFGVWIGDLIEGASKKGGRAA